MLKHTTALIALAACSSAQTVSDAVSVAESVEPPQAPVVATTDTAPPAPADDAPPEFTELTSTPIIAPLDTTVPRDDEPPTVTFSLRRGETLAHFARWSGLPVELIADRSALGLTGVYPVGTEVRLPLDPEARAHVELARTEHHVARADGYLDSRGGVAGTDFYTVRTGDTAWSISRNELGIPVWLLETYNPSVDLERLTPGTRLMVPALADTVADAGAPALVLQGPTE